MKAKINGIEVEGTPQEIMEFREKLALEERRKKTSNALYEPWVYPRATQESSGDFVNVPRTNITSNNTKGECPSNGPCFCTGACNGSALSGMSAAFEVLASDEATKYYGKYYK